MYVAELLNEVYEKLNCIIRFKGIWGFIQAFVF